MLHHELDKSYIREFFRFAQYSVSWPRIICSGIQYCRSLLL